MARSSECTEQHAQKVIDTADIVREAMLRQLRMNTSLPPLIDYKFGIDADSTDMRNTILCLLAVAAAFPSLSRAQAPVFEITPVHSSIKFDVKASVDIAGKFDKWDASLTFASPDETTGFLEIKIQAASVDTGSLMKNSKLKGKDFFDVDQNPLITFKSTKICEEQVTRLMKWMATLQFASVSNPEKMTLTVSGKGTGSGED